MNNGAGSNASNSKTPASATRASKRPSSDIRLDTNDSESQLVRNNVTAITDQKVALDHTAKTGLFAKPDSDDADTLCDRLQYGLLFAAKRAQVHAKDQSTQDAIWSLSFIHNLVHDRWRAKVAAMQRELDDAKKTIQTLKDASAWTSEPSLDSNQLAEAVMTRIKPVIEAQFAAQTRPGSPGVKKLDTLHQRLSILDSTVKAVNSNLESITASMASKPTYAAAAAADAHAPQDHYKGRPHTEQDAIARMEQKERRVLILADTTLQNVWLGDKPSELVAKAQHGVDEAFKAHPPAEPLSDLAAVSPRHAFHAGKSGVVFSFPTKQAVEWLTSDAVWAVFSANFEPGVSVRHHYYEILLRNLPLTYDPANPSFEMALRDANSLPGDQMRGARWMKSAARRSSTQRSAHVILSFRTPEAANSALDRGSLTLDNSVYRVERLPRDPPRCAKCQRHGHFIDKCKNTFTCGYCAGEGHHA